MTATTPLKHGNYCLTTDEEAEGQIIFIDDIANEVHVDFDAHVRIFPRDAFGIGGRYESLYVDVDQEVL